MNCKINGEEFVLESYSMSCGGGFDIAVVSKSKKGINLLLECCYKSSKIDLEINIGEDKILGQGLIKGCGQGDNINVIAHIVSTGPFSRTAN